MTTSAILQMNHCYRSLYCIYSNNLIDNDMCAVDVGMMMKIMFLNFLPYIGINNTHGS